MAKLQAPKGTKDMLPSEAYKWHFIENKFREISAKYGIREIRTPIFEHTEVFLRGVGETTDVVQKEMYTFDDKGGRSITLKPEGTAASVRAFIESSLYADTQPTKLFYITPLFRYENVQKGRLRQFHQYGIEIFGSQAPSLDAETIALAMGALQGFGIKNVSLNINSLGCPTCRARYNEALKKYLEENYDGLCETCKDRFEKNPMRIIDCKERSCKQITKSVPTILDYICEECSDHFSDVKKYLDALNIKYTVDPYIVRGLDYYTKTVFEFIHNGLTVCGGGRYDKLIEELGGPEMPAVGFGLGLERLLMLLQEENIEIPVPVYMDIFVGNRGEDAGLEAFKIVNALRDNGIKAESDHMKKSVKAQMKFGNKINARFTMILGDDELETRNAKLKRMDDGETFDVSLDNLESIIEIINS